MNQNINLDQINLSKELKFTSYNRILKMLLRPKIASQILSSRIKYKLTGKSTIVSANLFFGATMIVKLPEVISEVLAYLHYHEYDLSNVLLSQICPGMTFVDVGAHFGYFTLLASKLVSTTGHVHSFEPSKGTYEILQKNTSGKTNITINNLAVWSSNTILEFNEYDEKSSAFNSFTKPRTDHNEVVTKSKIQAVSLDTYFKNNLPDFIKIDAESAELEVLKGMEKIINIKHPTISVEVGDYISDIPTSRSCIEYLLDRGYNVFECTDGRLKPHVILDRYKYDNLVFLSNSKTKQNLA